MACAHTPTHVEFLSSNPQRGFWFYFWFSKKKSTSEQVRCAQGFRWLQGHHIHLHRKHMDMGKLSTLLQMGFWGVFTESDSQWIKTSQIKGQAWGGNCIHTNKAAHQCDPKAHSSGHWSHCSQRELCSIPGKTLIHLPAPSSPSAAQRRQNQLHEQ